MASPLENLDQLEQFRPYLRFLARMSWDERLQHKLDTSDLVQETLLRAHQKFAQFEGSTPEELAGWLRKILANIIADRQKHFARGRRAASRERSLEAVLAESSRRLAGLASGDPTPSALSSFNERALRLAEAIDTLPEDQQRAIVLHYWQEQTIPQIAQVMGRSPASVGGLVHRGLSKLRTALADLDE